MDNRQRMTDQERAEKAVTRKHVESNFKDEVKFLKESVQLLQVVADTVHLEKRGDEYWGCCPFHNERTPSFAIKVKRGEQVFFCQGCSKGGDVIRFIEFRDACLPKMQLPSCENYVERAAILITGQTLILLHRQSRL